MRTRAPSLAWKISPLGLILLGPCGSGKDTITAEMTHLDPRVALVEKLKCGSGRTATYHMVDRATLDDMAANHQLTGWYEQYGNIYAIDVDDVYRRQISGTRLVTHAGYVDEVAAIRANPRLRWGLVRLDCPLDIALERCIARGDTDIDARAQVNRDLLDAIAAHPALEVLDVVDTAVLDPTQAATQILRLFDPTSRP